MTGALESAYRELGSRVERVAQSGRPVVGIVGRDIPAMLVTAAGAQASRIPLAGAASDEARSIMGGAVDRAALVTLTAVLSGSLDFLRGLVIAHDSEASVRLFYTLQELHRRGRTAMPILMVDQVHLDRPSSLRFNLSQLSVLWETLMRWTGSPITTSSLEEALALHASTRAALESARRARGALPRSRSGVTALHGYAVAGALAPTEATALLTAHHTDDDDSGEVRPAGSLAVFVTGSAPLDDTGYRAIEGAGAVVVGEDHDWGDPILSDRLPEGIAPDREQVLAGLALSRLRGAPASATSSMAARARATRQGIERSGARALLSLVRAHDEAPLWDWRHQRERAGVPAAQLRGAAADDPAAIADAVRMLRETS